MSSLFPGVRVLAVDDDPLIRRVYVRALEKLSVEAIVVADGVAARAAIESSDFDLVLMDQNLGAEHGRDVVTALRGAARRMPKWVCTSGSIVSSDEVVDGFDGAAAKPPTVEKMRQLLEQWLGPGVDG